MRGLWRNKSTMNILDANIGSAKDNMSIYAGQDIVVYEPFAGCGTTLVECQKLCGLGQTFFREKAKKVVENSYICVV